MNIHILFHKNIDIKSFNETTNLGVKLLSSFLYVNLFLFNNTTMVFHCLNFLLSFLREKQVRSHY